MAYYLAESYRPAHDERTLAADAARVRSAARALGDVCVLSVFYAPGDELCFYLFESDSPDLVEAACRSARLRFDRVQPVVSIET